MGWSWHLSLFMFHFIPSFTLYLFTHSFIHNIHLHILNQRGAHICLNLALFPSNVFLNIHLGIAENICVFLICSFFRYTALVCEYLLSIYDNFPRSGKFEVPPSLGHSSHPLSASPGQSLLSACTLHPNSYCSTSSLQKKSIQLAKMSKNLRKKGENYPMLLTKSIRTFSTNVVYQSFKSVFCIFFCIEPFIGMPLSVMNTINAPGHDQRVLSQSKRLHMRWTKQN